MSKVIIIGGGLAGLSSAVFLKEAGYDVELIEASPKLGGRTRSFWDEKLGAEIDNGQHILMGAYKNTFEYLKLIHSDNSLIFQDSLSAQFINRQQQVFSLNSPNKLYPINLIRALLNYRALNRREKYYVFKFLISLISKNSKRENGEDVKSYLKDLKQSNNSIEALWEILGVGALNTKLSEASIKTFNDLLRKIFFAGNFASTIVIPKLPLSKIFVQPAEDYFQKKGIKYSLSEKVIGLESSSNRVSKIKTIKREINKFSNVVLAIPPHSIQKLNDTVRICDAEIEEMDYSPIITIHLWEHQKTFEQLFIGLIDSSVHWIFNHGEYISIVISAAEKMIDKQNAEIISEISDEISEYFPEFSFENIKYFKILKEKRATFKSNNKNLRIRENLNENFANLFFAGDWTNTNLPATIEGAILSGKNILRKI